MCTGSHPFIPGVGLIKAEFIYTTPGGVAENVLYFFTPEEITGGLLVGFGNSAHVAWAAEILQGQSVDVTLLKIVCTDVSAEDSFQITELVSETGVMDSRVLPSNATLAVSFRTDLTGRSNRGRAYHIGLSEGQVTGDTMSGTAGTDILANYTSFGILMQAEGFTHVIASYCADGEWRTEAKITPVQSYISDMTIDSQRRRLAGRGI